MRCCAWALFVLLLASLVCCQSAANRVDLGFFLFHNFPSFTPPPQCEEGTVYEYLEGAESFTTQTVDLVVPLATLGEKFGTADQV